MSTIAFVGHFDFGERITPVTLNLVDKAKSMQHRNIAVLVGDIGVLEKLNIYSQYGLPGVVNHYMKRRCKAKSACVLSQLPKQKNEIFDVVDIDDYNLALDILGIKKGCSVLNTDINRCKLKNEVMPKIIDKRLRSYKFFQEDTIVLSERKLRNDANNRLSVKSSKNWLCLSGIRKNAEGIYLLNHKLLNDLHVPVCRAITFALNEQFAEKGFSAIEYLVERRHFKSIFLGWLLFEKFQPELGYLKSRVSSAAFKISK